VQVHETEYVTPAAVRAILGLLRQEFDVILVDGGSHATPAQAAAVEVADTVVTVVTPDVLAMRSFRRTVQAWESLGVRAESDLHVLINRVSRDDVLNPDALARLTSAKVVSMRLPASFRRLERAVNSRDPGEVREAAWWSALERIGAEVGVSNVAAPAPEVRAPARRRGGARRATVEAGQVAVETVVLVPLVLAICLLAWQVALTALAFVWNGHAANAAARAEAIGEDPAAAARAAVPGSIRDQVQVSVLGDGTVKVTMQVPAICPGCAQLPGHISQTSHVVEEPS
jgi:pilus assembly protein CpaE